MAKVEVCAYSLESCINAAKAGAHRVELCAGLYEGGTTPSAGLISLVKTQVPIELFVMIRPRGGDFLYNDAEFKVMRADILHAKNAQADGIVLGILQKNGTVDLAKTKEMVDMAYPMKVTFHRAIDVTPDPLEALEAIVEAGCIRILTSGQKNKAEDGIETIEKLVKAAHSRIEIMAGSGLNIQNARLFLQKGVDAIHLTGKSMRESEMEYRKKDVSMCDVEGISEFEIAYSDYLKIKEVVGLVQH